MVGGWITKSALKWKESLKPKQDSETGNSIEESKLCRNSTFLPVFLFLCNSKHNVFRTSWQRKHLHLELEFRTYAYICKSVGRRDKIALNKNLEQLDFLELETCMQERENKRLIQGA